MSERSGPSQRRFRDSASIAILAVCCALACGRGDEVGPEMPPAVTVATARIGAVPDLREYVGNARAAQRIDIRARVRGYLVEHAFADGARVAAGDLLFRIDPRPFEAALAAAKAELARTRANATRAARDLERAEELYRANVVSISVLDARRADRDASAAAVVAAEADVRTAELDLSYCRIEAPITGRISRAQVDVGNLVGESGQDTILAELVQEDPIYVYFAPTERDRLEVIQGVREGRIPSQRTGTIPVRLRRGDGTPYPHEGVVDYVEPTIEPTRGTITVRALLPNPDGDLKPGEFVRVIAVFPDLTDAVLVPQRAILDEQGGSYVLVVRDDDTVVQRPVVIGSEHDGLQHVREGLAAGERVVVDGVQQAQPGEKVRPQPLEAPAAADDRRGRAGRSGRRAG